MKLSNILKNVNHKIIGEENSIEKEISHLSIDSRNIRKNTLFICIPGFRVDGHNFINHAADSGACAFIVEREVEAPSGATIIQVENTRVAMATIAANFFSNPQNSCRFIGVTGTNGKTSSTFYIQAILMEAQQKTGIIGTVDTKIDNTPLNIDFATSTTPDSIELMQIIRHMADKNVSNIVMEVTSHALALHKVEALQFDVSIFTNLTRDHLDLHGTMENYRDAKAKLFTMSKNCIINIDDPYGPHMAQISTGKVTTYSIDKDSHIRGKNISYFPTGCSFQVDIEGQTQEFYIPIPGKFSVYNALGVIGAALVMAIPMETIKTALKNLNVVPGRIQRVDNNVGLTVIVDYSHTPDSLKSIIEAVRDFTKKRVITVFGCGGDRDKAKRPLMGEIATTLGDYTILTSDNPRTENPSDILADIEAGAKGHNYTKIEDRYKAIQEAIKMATKDDTVIIAGKGHENYQIFKHQTIPFDDVEVAKKCIGDLHGTN